MVTDIILGNLGRVNELRELNGGNCVLNISVANTPRMKKGEEWVDGETIWYDVSIWGQEARNFVASGLKAGAPLIILGRRQAQRLAAYEKGDTSYPERVVQQVTAEAVSVRIGRWNVVGGSEKANSNNTTNTNTGSTTAKKQETKSDDIFADETKSTKSTTTAKVDEDDIFGDGDDDIFGDF